MLYALSYGQFTVLSRAADRGWKRKTLLPPMRIKKNSRNCKYKMGPKINTFSFFNIKSNGKHIKIHFCKYQVSTNINKYQQIHKNSNRDQQISITNSININKYQQQFIIFVEKLLKNIFMK